MGTYPGDTARRDASAGGPAHGSLAEQVAVEMRNAFATIAPVVDHQAIAAGFESETPGNLGRLEEEVPQEGLIFWQGLADSGDRLFGNHQDMHRGLGLDIVQCQNLIVFIGDFGGDLAGDDAFEEGHRPWI